MALQTSGQITLQQIGLEFNQTAPYTVSEVMGLPGTPSTGPVSFTDFYGLENVNQWNIEASAIHDNIEYSSSTSSITLNWNQATQAASGNNSVQPYDNDFDDWEVGDLLILATKLQFYELVSGYLYHKQTNILNSPSTSWVRAGLTYSPNSSPFAKTAIFAKVLTVSDINGNGSYSFSITGTANNNFTRSFGFSWWRLRKSISSGHQIVYLNSERKNIYTSGSGGVLTDGTPPSVNDGINGTNQYTTGSNVILVGVGFRNTTSATWGTQTTYSSNDLSDMNSNSFSHYGTTNNTVYQNHFASIQTWDANDVPDPNLSASMSVNSGTWAWLYTNP